MKKVEEVFKMIATVFIWLAGFIFGIIVLMGLLMLAVKIWYQLKDLLYL